MNRWTVWSGVAAVGVCALALLTPRNHPAALWKVSSDGEQSQVRSREISAAFGVDTEGWAGTVSGDTDRHAGYVAEQHPNLAAARRLSPVYPKVALQSPHGQGRIVVTLSASGDINSWEWKGYPKGAAIDDAAARRLADGALARIAGTQASDFHLLPDLGRNDDAVVFAYERTSPLAQRFNATIDAGRVVKVELTTTYGHDVDTGLSARKKYSDWFQGAIAVGIDFVLTAVAICVYVFWAIRRVVRHRFVLALSATVLVWGAVYWVNWASYDQRFDTISSDSSFLENTFGLGLAQLMLLLLFIVLGGATDAIGLRPQLLTLRSIFSSALFNRPAGESILTGLMCGPLLAALPLAVSALHLFGSVRSGDYDAALIYSAHPAVDALDVMLNPALLGLFGFYTGFLARYIRKPWLSFALLAVPGILLVSTLTVPSESLPVSFLTSGALLFLAYWQLFLRVDLLAVLTAGWTARVFWNATALLLQPSASVHSSGLVACGFVALAACCAAIVARRGGELPVEDAETPAVITSQREALMKEFSIAHRVQQHMLPHRPPEIPSCSVAASCHPAQEVGGDLFDFLPLPDGRWSMGVGDVSGKGVHAALYMTLTKGLLVATTQDSSDLLEIVGNVNGHVHAATERKTFVTLAMGAFDPETLAFDHVRAGHNPIVWRRPGASETSLLNAPGLGLGIVSDRLFRRSLKLEKLQLSAGDALVFYSDGVTEAMNIEQEQFGEERLMRAVESADGLDAEGVRERILSRVREFLNGVAPQDDMTIVVLRVN